VSKKIFILIYKNCKRTAIITSHPVTEMIVAGEQGILKAKQPAGTPTL